MKWFFKMSVATALTVSMTTTAFAATQIKASDWAVSSMEKAYQLELIPEELLSHGTENMTRQEFTKMAIQFYQKVTKERINIDNIHNPFWDTNQPEIVFAYAMGIISGKQEHIFEPDSPITREQMAIVLVKTLEKSNIELKEKNTEIEFKDINQLDKSVLPYIKKIQMAGIMNGFEGYFSPFKDVTVEEAVVAFTAIYESTMPSDAQKTEQSTEAIPTEQLAKVEQPTETTPTEQPAKVEQPTETTPTEQPAKTEQPTETTPTEQPAKVEQPTETTPTEQPAKTEQPTETTLTEQSAKTEQPKQDTKTNTTSQNQSDGIVIDGKTISIGQTVSKLKSDWGEPSRIDQNSYSLERYVYINNYKHFFMVSIKDNKIAEIFTNDMTFQYKGVTGKMDANDITNVRYLDLKNFRAELQDEGKDTFVLLNKDYKAEGILIRTSDYKQQLQLRYSQQFLDNFKTELIDIINSARVQEGAAVLTSDDTAANVAYYHSWDMSKNNYVGYTNQKGENPFDRMTAGGVKYTMAGESVVKIEGEDAINTYHQLMMEAGTRTNLLNPELTHYGLAAFDSNFTIYVTLDLFAPAKE